MNSTISSEAQKALTEEEKKEALEAILFAAGFAVPYTKLAQLLGGTPGQIKRFVKSYAEEYNSVPCRGILLLYMDDRCQLCTKADYKNYIREALGIRLSGKLSASCLEVLAIIAYHQPVTKAYVEQVRGVDCTYALGALCDKQLVTPQGRLDAPGRPMLYATTENFLRCFGISSLDDLPNLNAVREKEDGGYVYPVVASVPEDGEEKMSRVSPDQMTILPPEEGAGEEARRSEGLENTPEDA